MLILHISDIHCANHMLKRVADTQPYDLVVATGDFECVDTAEAFLSLPYKLLAVTGNIDNAAVARRLAEAGVLLDGRVESVGGLVFAGVGGLDVASSLSRLERVLPEKVDVLLTHHPPKGVLDRTFIGLRAGLREIRELVERIRPRAHLFGHIHEARGVHGPVGGVLYVNAGPLKKGSYAILYPGLERAELRSL